MSERRFLYLDLDSFFCCCEQVRHSRRFETPYRSAQGWLWLPDDVAWQLAKKRYPAQTVILNNGQERIIEGPYRRKKQRVTTAQMDPLIEDRDTR